MGGSQVGRDKTRRNRRPLHLGVKDLLSLVGNWGEHHILTVDIHQDFVVDVVDILQMISDFGDCQLVP